MKLVNYTLCIFLLLAAHAVQAQQVDSIFFHLYTDSLKKGVHNYINVDGKLSNGRWQPLTARELDFTCSAGKFQGNSLIIDSAFKDSAVTVKATLKSNPQLWKEIVIYIKTVDTVERLKTVDEVLQGGAAPPRRRGRRND